ncbi:hypothetical protein [Pseudomonas sp. NA-150]|uniref:hypothetical protein n=1 Tax=Pseudomonas sp. NA-150 TaxID=3367525 RepID=UPI0037CA1BB2
MNRNTLKRQWLAASILAACLAPLAGCTHHPAAVEGSRCYATAMPTVGEGGLAWGDNQKTARTSALDNCERYAGRSGGTPGTCRIVEARCK